jgi:N-methylhydantoinase A
MTHQLGVDVGGTFTDFVALDAGGRTRVFKCLTTPDDPSRAVLEGSAELAARADLPVSQAERIIHGTTLVANSLITRHGARTALITTDGFGDVLELGREARYDIYDLALARPEPLVPRALRFEIRERILTDGSVLEPLDEAAARRLASEMREQGVESVAVALLNAYRNPIHERRLAQIISDEAPQMDVTLSSDIAPEWREYERTSTATANAFVRPLVRRYLARLEDGFARQGAAGRLFVMLSQGGITTAPVAADYAVQLVESGPVGGVLAAEFFGRRIGLSEMIAFDMGGTTSKISVIERGTPPRVMEFEVAREARFKRGSGLPLKVATIELIEIGAGGGSIGRRDNLGLLKVGPESAGALPGPACYGRGGTEPTVTDADLHLGLLDPDYFLGGRMTLQPDNAKAALARLGVSFGLDAAGCAAGMFEIVNRQMALAMRTAVVERGHDPHHFTLVATGGAGPVHAYEIARHLRIPRVLFPPAAGVASSLGFLVAPLTVDLVRTLPARLGNIGWQAVAVRYAEMEAQARALLERAGADPGSAAFERRVDMRYSGQGYEVAVELPRGPLSTAAEPDLRQAFDAEYRRRYGAFLETAPAEALHWRLHAEIPATDIEVTFDAPTSGSPLRGQRPVWFAERQALVPTQIYDRYRLAPSTLITGPALIEEAESTIVIGPSASAEVDARSNVILTFGE